MTSLHHDSEAALLPFGETLRKFGPALGLVPGFVLLLLTALFAVSAGMINVIDPPYELERTLTFMMAVAAFPAPYVIFSGVSFIFMHCHPSRHLMHLFYSAVPLFLMTPALTLWYRFNTPGDQTFGRRLDLALVDNLLAAIAIGILFLLIMGTIVVAGRWAQRDEMA